LLENAFITLKKHDEIQIDTIFKPHFATYFFLGAVTNGHAQQEFVLKQKWFQQKKSQ
jgi:hypothetical protein